MNGIAERYNRVLNEGMRACILDADMHKSFWVEAMAYTVYVRNRLPTSTLPRNITPFEA